MSSYDISVSSITMEEIEQLKQSLPKQLLFNHYPMYLYQGFWALESDLIPIISFQNHFKAQDSDIIISSIRKTGTTWLKALVFAVCNRANHPVSQSPLLGHNPHEVVPQLESNIYVKSKSPDFTNIPSPRIFGTHVPFQALPTSIKDSKCKIIYICRNPFDTLISSWLFYQTVDGGSNLKPELLGYYLNMFCNGTIPFGPFEDHVLGFWNQSVQNPNKVLIIKYEDLKADPKGNVKRIAEFVGCPISEQEEGEGVVDDIIKLCSFDTLKDAAAPDKSAEVYPNVKNEWFFRKGEIGDWVHYLSPSMAEKLEKIVEDKFHGSGFTFTKSTP